MVVVVLFLIYQRIVSQHEIFFGLHPQIVSEVWLELKYSIWLFLEQWVVALRDTEQQRFAAILTTLSSPTPFDTDIAQKDFKKKQRWSGKEKTVEHLLDGFFIVNAVSSSIKWIYSFI